MSETLASYTQYDMEGQWSASFLCEATLDFESPLWLSVFQVTVLLSYSTFGKRTFECHGVFHSQRLDVRQRTYLIVHERKAVHGLVTQHND